MIDDATLTGWERLTRSDLCDNRPCERLESALQDAIAEIRRLQNELDNRDYVEWRRAYDSDLGKRIEILSQNLTAHQAVVRELADAARHLMLNGFIVSCAECREAEKTLAHPFVQQARETTHAQ